MEVGWYNLAHDQLDYAIDLDPDYYMAYIGKVLSNENLGYGMSDAKIGNYKDKLIEINSRPDKQLRLTFQEQLLLDALIALQSADTFSQGLFDMDDVFNEDSETVRDNILAVIRGIGLLLSVDSHITLDSVADASANVYALQLLTHSLNPYNNENRTTTTLMNAAIKAVFTFQGLDIRGAAQITADSVDISEYYGRWSLAYTRLSAQRNFLFSSVRDNPTSLFTIVGDSIVLQGLDLDYMSISVQQINEYERLHFYELQVNTRIRLCVSRLSAEDCRNTPSIT